MQKRDAMLALKKKKYSAKLTKSEMERMTRRIWKFDKVRFLQSSQKGKRLTGIPHPPTAKRAQAKNFRNHLQVSSCMVECWLLTTTSCSFLASSFSSSLLAVVVQLHNAFPLTVTLASEAPSSLSSSFLKTPASYISFLFANMQNTVYWFIVVFATHQKSKI